LHRTLIVLIFLFCSHLLAAESATTKKTSSAGQDALIKPETAIVYDSASFDGSAIAYLAKGEGVRISKKTYGKIQKFYKLRLPNGKFGYVSTLDVATGKRAGAKPVAKNSSKPMSDQERDRVTRARLKRALSEPMMYNKWFGLFAGSMNFREKIENASGKASLLTYGLKITGPDILIGGPIMDINLLLHFGAPEYYNDISLTKPSGFLFFGDTMMLIPFGLGDNTGFYVGLGPMFKYANYKWVTNAGLPQAKTDFNVGGSFSTGLAYRLSAFSVRIEGKYYVEKVTHTQIQFALQTLY
jgi:hypothetical protein